MAVGRPRPHYDSTVRSRRGAFLQQPYTYRRLDLREPDWRRFPGWQHVSEREWYDLRWQRLHSIRDVRGLERVIGRLADDCFYTDLQRDQETAATMSLLVTPYALNMIVPDATPTTDAIYADPVRRYVLPVVSDRDPDWPSHPLATRDSLHESEMWVTEGLTHRYPTKVLAEVVATCPLYCGHCTRMDLVGASTPQVAKYRFETRPSDRLERMIEYLRVTPTVRDVVVSGGDVANLPWSRLELFVEQLLGLENIRDIRLATKALMALPQYWLRADIRTGLERLSRMAFDRGVSLAVHTHVNAAQQVTPLVAAATKAVLEAGVRDVRNQAVLLRGVNATTTEALDLCFALLDGAMIVPYYFYVCDMVPASEHWRLAIWEAQELQEWMMGYLPGFATPRVVCDVPYVGKRWVHQENDYDRVRGISYWSKNYKTPLDESGDDDASERQRFPYYDPIRTLPAEGQEWWRARGAVADGTLLPEADRISA